MKAKIYRLIYALPLIYLIVKFAIKASAELIDTDGTDIG